MLSRRKDTPASGSYIISYHKSFSPEYPEIALIFRIHPAIHMPEMPARFRNEGIAE